MSFLYWDIPILSIWQASRRVNNDGAETFLAIMGPPYHPRRDGSRVWGIGPPVKRVHVHLHECDYVTLKRIAKRRGESVACVMRDAVRMLIVAKYRIMGRPQYRVKP